jgi:hypothetical protein
MFLILEGCVLRCGLLVVVYIDIFGSIYVFKCKDQSLNEDITRNLVVNLALTPCFLNIN